MPAPQAPAEIVSFPSSFAWGTSTAAYQIEGGWQDGGKGLSIWDAFSHTPGKVKDGSTGDVAADHLRRFRQDVKLMAQMSLKCAQPAPQPRGELSHQCLAVAGCRRNAASCVRAQVLPFLHLVVPHHPCGHWPGEPEWHPLLLGTDRRADQARHPPGGDALPLGLAAAAADGERRLAEPQDGQRLCGVRARLLRALWRPRQALDHAQRAGQPRRLRLRARRPRPGPHGGAEQGALRRRALHAARTRARLRHLPAVLPADAEGHPLDRAQRRLARAARLVGRGARRLAALARVHAGLAGRPALLWRLPGGDAEAARRAAADLHRRAAQAAPQLDRLLRTAALLEPARLRARRGGCAARRQLLQRRDGQPPQRARRQEEHAQLGHRALWHGEARKVDPPPLRPRRRHRRH